MESHDPSHIRHFGLFEVDLRAEELRKNGVKIKLQAQPFQVLVSLIRRPGEVVTREELRHQLWPEDTFVDFDHGLNAAIKRLRDALGESADAPVFIETLSRRGYKFIAPRGWSPSIQRGVVRGCRSSHPTPPTCAQPWHPCDACPCQRQYVVVGWPRCQCNRLGLS